MTKGKIVFIIVAVPVLAFGSLIMLQRFNPIRASFLSDQEQRVAASSTDGTIYVDRNGGWEMKIPNDWYPDADTKNSLGPGARFCHSKASRPSPNCLDHITVTPYTPIAAKHGLVSTGTSYEKTLIRLQKEVASHTEITSDRKDTLVTGARVIKVKNPWLAQAQFFGVELSNSNGAEYYVFYPNAYIAVQMSDDKFEPMLASMLLVPNAE